MGRNLTELENSIEWNLVSRRTVQGIPNPGNRYYKIPTQSFAIDSYVVQIGLRNDLAPTHWQVGGYATMLLPILPSSTTDFTAAVAAYRQVLRLGVLNLVVLPKLVSPWILEIRFPKWMAQMYLEVWKYDGEDVDEFARFDELAQRLDAVP